MEGWSLLGERFEYSVPGHGIAICSGPGSLGGHSVDSHLPLWSRLLDIFVEVWIWGSEWETSGDFADKLLGLIYSVSRYWPSVAHGK